MNPSPHCRFLLCCLVAFSVVLTGSPTATVVAASANAKTIRHLKRLKKRVRHLKKNLEAATRTTPSPVVVPFLELVEVGEAGNAADLTGFGEVLYDFKIGKYEVTLKQYADFLNHVAAADPYGLYRHEMEDDEQIAGILRSGESGSYTYSVIGDGNRPVSYVSWFDAARFCNWMHQGRPFGPQGKDTTEQGAYALNGATSGVSLARVWGARYWIPSEDEWYKAAYFDPRLQSAGGAIGDDHYWNYPSRSDTPSGNQAGYLLNQGNFFNGNYSVEPGPNRLTPGGAFLNSYSFFRVYDLGGNLWEWNDSIITAVNRGQRGGAWADYSIVSRATERGQNLPEDEQSGVGFRVAAQ